METKPLQYLKVVMKNGDVLEYTNEYIDHIILGMDNLFSYIESEYDTLAHFNTRDMDYYHYKVL